MMKDIGEEAAAAVQPHIESAERFSIAPSIASLGDNGVNDLSSSTAKLTEGLVAAYQPQLEKIQKELSELTQKQESMIDRMGVENQKIEGNFCDAIVNEMFLTIKSYQGKLSLIEKEMRNIHERTFKLKKRALRLQHIKQKEALSREQHRQQEIRREEELIGKPPSL